MLGPTIYRKHGPWEEQKPHTERIMHSDTPKIEAAAYVQMCITKVEMRGKDKTGSTAEM